MAIFRVHKTHDYTIMSNHHLKNKGLSLKAKGLLSLILSLPDDWNYTTRGLAAICKEGVDSISGALKELEKAGYIVRHRLRDDKGRITDTEYAIYETPREVPENTPDTEEPDSGIPDTEAPYPENPDMENPHPVNAYPVLPGTEKPAQSKTYQGTTNPSKTKKSTAMLTNPSNPHPSKDAEGERTAEEQDAPAMTAVDVDKWREIVRRNIGYDDLVTSTNQDQLDNMVEIITETLCSSKSHIAVAGESYPAPLVKQRLLTLNSLHIQYVLECLQKNTTHIRNIKRYLLTALFNAPATMGSYYDAAVCHDQARVDSWYDDFMARGD